MARATEKMIDYVIYIEDYLAWANIECDEWQDDSFDSVKAWLDKYVPIYKKHYAKHGEIFEMQHMSSWELDYM